MKHSLLPIEFQKLNKISLNTKHLTSKILRQQEFLSIHINLRLQKVQLLSFHQVKHAHKNNSITAQPFHWSKSVYNIVSLSPQLDQQTEQKNLLLLSETRQDLTVNYCSFITNCDIYLRYSVQLKLSFDRKTFQLNFEKRNWNLMSIVNKRRLHPRQFTLLNFRVEFKQQISLLLPPFKHDRNHCNIQIVLIHKSNTASKRSKKVHVIHLLRKLSQHSLHIHHKPFKVLQNIFIVTIVEQTTLERCLSQQPHYLVRNRSCIFNVSVHFFIFLLIHPPEKICPHDLLQTLVVCLEVLGLML